MNNEEIKREEAQEILTNRLSLYQQLLIEDSSTLPEKLIDCMLYFSERQIENHKPDHKDGVVEKPIPEGKIAFSLKIVCDGEDFDYIHGIMQERGIYYETD